MEVFEPDPAEDKPVEDESVDKPVDAEICMEPGCNATVFPYVEKGEYQCDKCGCFCIPDRPRDEKHPLDRNYLHGWFDGVRYMCEALSSESANPE